LEFLACYKLGEPFQQHHQNFERLALELDSHPTLAEFARGLGVVAPDSVAMRGVASAKAVMPSWAAAMLMAAEPKKRRRFWLIPSDILTLLTLVSPFFELIAYDGGIVSS
jgi:hypothetical protein